MLIMQKSVEEDFKRCLLQKESFKRIPFQLDTLVHYEYPYSKRFPFYVVHSYSVDVGTSSVFNDTPGLTIHLGPIWADSTNSLEIEDTMSCHELGFVYVKRATVGLLASYLIHPNEDWRELAQLLYKRLPND